jgi:hypothetical protein
MEITVIDDYLEPEYFKLISNTVNAPFFPWHFNENVSDFGEDAIGRFGFSAMVFNEYKPITKYEVIGQLFHALEWFVSKNEQFTRSRLFRLRADMVTNTGNEVIHAPHVDHNFPHWTSVFYLNDTDGETILFETEETEKERMRITPKPNRIVFFDGLITHTGMSPMHHQRRTILNSNFVSEAK